MAPSRYLGLPWREWGATDVALNMALHTLEAMACPCGCGQPVDECHDEDNAGRYQVEVTTCQARVALAAFQADHKGDLEPGSLLSVRLLGEGETPADPLVFDPARAAEEYERHMRSLGRD